jgi:hypothetical protein
VSNKSSAREIFARNHPPLFYVCGQIKAIPSALGWNSNETGVKLPIRISPEVIVAIDTDSGSATVAEQRDDAQLTVAVASFAFTDSNYRFLLSNSKHIKNAAIRTETI